MKATIHVPIICDIHGEETVEITIITPDEIPEDRNRKGSSVGYSPKYSSKYDSVFNKDVN